MSRLSGSQLRRMSMALLVICCGACVRRTVVTYSPSVTPGSQKAGAARSAVAQNIDRQVLNAVDLGEGDIELKALRERVTRDPADLASRLSLAKHYAASGFPEVAVEHLRLACERAPKSLEAHLELARLLRREGEAAEAARMLTDFAGKTPGDVEVWAWLGLLRDETGDWKQGEDAHRTAVAMAPQRDDLHNNLGYCLLEQGRAQEAAEEFRTALRLNKNSAFAQNNLGIAVSARPSEAVLHWQSISDPGTAHSNMAAILIEAGDYAGARKEIAVALSYNQQHPAALTNLRLLSLLDGKPAEYQLGRAPSQWWRIRAGWQRFWASNGVEDRGQTVSGKAVASRIEREK